MPKHFVQPGGNGCNYRVFWVLNPGKYYGKRQNETRLLQFSNLVQQKE